VRQRQLSACEARRLTRGAALVAVLACGTSWAAAQDVLMATSGMSRGGYEVASYPVLVTSGDNELGVFVRGGVGLTEKLAVRARAGFYSDLTYLGATGDLPLPGVLPVDLALSFGAHRSGFDRSADILGFDLALAARRRVAERSAIYGGLDLDYELPESPYDRFTRARVVAGVDTRIVDNVSLLVEGGIGLNNDSPSYLSAGLAVRLR
jgi:hypothetical protein